MRSNFLFRIFSTAAHSRRRDPSGGQIGMSGLAPTTCAFRAHALWACARKGGLELLQTGQAFASVKNARDISPQECLQDYLQAFPTDREVRSNYPVPRMSDYL